MTNSIVDCLFIAAAAYCDLLASDILVLKLISVLVFILFSRQNFYFI